MFKNIPIVAILLICSSLNVEIYAEDRYPPTTTSLLPQLATPYIMVEDLTEPKEINPGCTVYPPTNDDYILLKGILTGDIEMVSNPPISLQEGLKENQKSTRGFHPLTALQYVSYEGFTQILLLIYWNSKHNNNNIEYHRYNWYEEALGISFTAEGDIELLTEYNNDYIDIEENIANLETTWMRAAKVNPGDIKLAIFVESLVYGIIGNPDPRVQMQCSLLLIGLAKIPYVREILDDLFIEYDYNKRSFLSLLRSNAVIGTFHYCDIDGTYRTVTMVNERISIN